MLIASTVKILTAITIIENYNLGEEIIVTEKDISEVGSKVYLKKDEKIKRIDLLYALMLRSANDAASCLSGNNSVEFMKKMNNTAKKIGMKNSVFENASGLDEKEYNLSTTYDMAILSAYASENEIFKNISSAHYHNCKTNMNSYSWSNKHKLVKRNEDFIWGKTGYTKKSNRILVSNYKNDNKDLIIVTINESDDWNKHYKLVNNVQDYYFVTVFKKGVYSTDISVTYYLHIKEDIIIPIKRNEKEDVDIVFKLFKDYAKIEIYLNNILILYKNVDVYDKENFDIDLVIDIFKI